MKPRKEAEQALLAIFKNCSSEKVWSEKELVKRAQAKCMHTSVRMKETHLRKALSRLEQEGLVFSEDGSFYRYRSSPSQRRSFSGVEDSVEEMEEERLEQAQSAQVGLLNDGAIPFAEMMRRKCQGRNEESAGDSNIQTKNIDDVDEEIRRLEAELELDRENDSDTSHDEVEEVHNRNVSFRENATKVYLPKKEAVNPTYNIGVVSLSALANERIAPLPTACLPQTKKRTLKGIDANPSQAKKKQATDKVSEGLKEAVKEVLDGYVARSSERLPFYCRVCAKQLPNEPEFLAHKESQFHNVAVDMERKASFCRLCRKQFTSPVQLKEHLKSRPHRERLQKVTAGRDRRDEPRRRGSAMSGSSNRQWC